jgi:hypothetical protein
VVQLHSVVIAIVYSLTHGGIVTLFHQPASQGRDSSQDVHVGLVRITLQVQVNSAPTGTTHGFQPVVEPERTTPKCFPPDCRLASSLMLSPTNVHSEAEVLA